MDQPEPGLHQHGGYDGEIHQQQVGQQHAADLVTQLSLILAGKRRMRRESLHHMELPFRLRAGRNDSFGASDAVGGG